MKIRASSQWPISYFLVRGPKNFSCQGAVRNYMDMEWISQDSMVGLTMQPR